MIRRAASHNSDAVIIVAGCYSEIASDEAASLGCADLIIGTGDKTSVCDRALQLLTERGKKRDCQISIAPKEE